MFRLLMPVRSVLALMLGQPQGLAFLPAATLAAYWLGGETALILAALAVPLVFAMAGLSAPGAARPGVPQAPPPRAELVRALDETLAQAPMTGMSTACIAIALDGVGELRDQFGTPAAETSLARVAERLSTALRGNDVLGAIGEAGFAIALAPTRRTDLEAILQISARMQDAVREPISIDGATAYLSCSIGFCLPGRCPEPSGEAMLAAAEAALREASQNGPGAIRSFSPTMRIASTDPENLADEIEAALISGDIRPWFQPQISTDTGAVTGFEALVRWRHPEQGLILPADFLPAVARAGLSERLSEVILFNAFAALRSWDKAGLAIPSVGVNFSGEELRNPALVDRIRWELDRFDLAPDRLTVEILESVMSKPGDDIITRNIADLAALGCGIDLDDFGTGHASIATIRRFAIRRLKIDRSFVTRVDRDREQQDMVAAILSMAERLGLATLAEGVETIGEHAMLAQLGCGHVQGFGIARPMAFEDTIAWVGKHREKLAEAAELGRRTG